MINVDCIFFDVDGTLVDARSDIASAMNYTLRQLRLPQKTFDEIISYVGTGVSDLVAKSMGGNSARLIEDGVRIYGDYLTKHPAGHARLYPHVKETLEYFKDKRKFILTNRYAKFARPVLKALGILNYFEDIIGGDDENCLKPSACVIDSIVPKLGIDKARALIVGDMAIDIMTGKNSGIRNCWVRHGLGKAEDVEPLKPDFVIDDLIELTKLIK